MLKFSGFADLTSCLEEASEMLYTRILSSNTATSNTQREEAVACHEEIPMF